MLTIVIIVVLVLVVAAIAAAALKDRRAWNALSAVQQEHQRQIKAADKQVKAADRSYSSAVNTVRRDLQQARSAKKLARFKTDYVGGWKDAFAGTRECVLYDDRIKTPSGEHALTASTSAMVDTAGNFMHSSRSTVTRMAAGTAIAGPLGFLVGVAAKKGKTVDSRELFLMIEGPDWADSLVCEPDKDARKVREFAQAVNLAARNVERVTAAREKRVRELEEHLRRVEADRGAIEQAEAARSALGPGPAAGSDRATAQ
jgi:hypothetical protein